MVRKCRPRNHGKTSLARTNLSPLLRYEILISVFSLFSSEWEKLNLNFSLPSPFSPGAAYILKSLRNSKGGSHGRGICGVIGALSS